jgi:AraC-like DNA-binding protein
MFQTDYCGYNIHNPNRDVIYRPEGRMDYLLLYLTCRMEFFFPCGELSDNVVERDGICWRCVVAEPGDCILYAPGVPQYYRAIEGFSNSFVHFTCDVGEMDNCQMPLNQIFHPSMADDIVELMRRIQVEYLSNQIDGANMLDLLIRQLLLTVERSCRLVRRDEDQMEQYVLMQRFRVEMLQHCNREWPIERMCQETHLGRTQFYRTYQYFFHTTPKEDLLQARLDMARYLLTNRELLVSEVAEQCGFSNIYYFNRYFKRAIGCSPSDYRKR